MNEFARRLWVLIGPYHKTLYRYAGGAVVRQAMVVGGGYLLVWVLRAAMGHTAVPAWMFVAALIAFDAGLLRLDLGLNWMFASRVSFPMFGFLRSKALANVMQMPQAWHQRQHSGELAGNVNNGVGRVVQTSEALGRELLPGIIRTVLSLVPLVWCSPYTSPLVTAAAVVFAWLTWRENIARRPFRRSRQDRYARDFGMFSECVEYVQPITAFGQTRRILRSYDELQDGIAAQGIEEMCIARRFSWQRSLSLSVAKRACLGIWLWQFRAGALDVAMVMYLGMLLEDLFNSFSGYASLLERVQDGLEPARALFGLLDEGSARELDAPAAPVAVPDSIEIELRNVHFAYGDGAAVLRDFSLSVEAGSVIGIVGRSGAGKTTLQHLLSRTYEVDEGQILIGGQDIRTWPLEQLRGVFAPVSQNGGVFLSGENILETIRFARPDATVEDVIDAARCACIHADILRMPDGYHTRLGQRGATISKGQQQRMALAQALIALADRKVLVLDEFTSALDARTEQEVLTNIAPRLRGKTVMIIAHRLATLRKIADRIIVIDRGGIAEMGAHEDLLHRGGSYAELARLQAIA